MSIKDIRLRSFRKEDEEQLLLWKDLYQPAELELIHGFHCDPGVETVIAEKNDKILLSMTASMCAIFDPLLKNPDADPKDLVTAILMAEAALSYVAQKTGAVEAYLAVSEEDERFQQIARKCGYQETAQFCKIFRKSLVEPMTEFESNSSQQSEPESSILLKEG